MVIQTVILVKKNFKKVGLWTVYHKETIGILREVVLAGVIDLA